MMHRNKDGVWTFDEFHRKYIKLNQWELESSQAQSVKQEIYESWTIFIFLVKKRQLTSYSNFGSIPTTVEKARDYKHFFSSKFPKLAISHRWRFNVRDKMTLGTCYVLASIEGNVLVASIILNPLEVKILKFHHFKSKNWNV